MRKKYNVCALVYSFVYKERTLVVFPLSGSVPSGTGEKEDLRIPFFSEKRFWDILSLNQTGWSYTQNERKEVIA